MSACNATLTVRDLHECEREAGHPLDDTVWKQNAETHQCCGYQWIDGAEGSTPHADVEVGGHDCPCATGYGLACAGCDVAADVEIRRQEHE